MSLCLYVLKEERKTVDRVFMEKFLSRNIPETPKPQQQQIMKAMKKVTFEYWKIDYW